MPKTLQTPKTPKTPKRPHQWHPKARSIAFSGRSSVPFARHLQPTDSQGHINGFLWASSAGKSYPKARSIAFSGRSSVPLARHSQPTGIPRPHPWLFMGVQACRLPALKRLKRSKPLKPLKGHINGTPRPDPLLFLGGPACRWPGIRSQQASQGHIHGFLWASKLAVCQPLNA